MRTNPSKSNKYNSNNLQIEPCNSSFLTYNIMHLFYIHFSWYLQWKRCVCVDISKCHHVRRHLPNFIFVVDPMLSTVARSRVHSYTFIHARYYGSAAFPHGHKRATCELWIVHFLASVLVNRDHGQNQRIDSTTVSNLYSTRVGKKGRNIHTQAKWQ
jgi:hypothetical protein